MIPHTVFNIRTVAMATVAVLAIAGCRTNGDSVTDPVNSAAIIPWKLELNHHAIVTLPNQDVQLSATPRKLDGSTLATSSGVTYSTSDESVTVDANGKLRGTTARAQVLVYATMSGQTGDIFWRVADTARVTIVDVPYSFATYKMELVAPTTPVPAGRVHSFAARVYDAGGNVVTTNGTTPVAPMSYYKSTAPSNVYFYNIRWNGSGAIRYPGETSIIAKSYIFGKEYRDSLKFSFTWPDTAVLLVHRQNSQLNPSPSVMSQTDLTILKNGKVVFRNNNPTAAADIVFDNQSAVIGGNIPSVPATPGAAVQFPNTGKFTYKSNTWGFTGTITVVDP